MIKQIVHITYITLLFCLPYNNIQAEENNDILTGADIAEILVNDTEMGIKANAVTSSYSMDNKKIEATGALQVSDALKFFSGVAIKDYGGIGGLKTISVRGLGASHTAVAYDGIIESNMQTGQIDLGRISTFQVNSIRLVNGTDNNLLQPAILSSSATTLNVESSKPIFTKNKYSINSSLRYGSFGTTSAMLALSNRLSEKWASTLSAEWNESEGNYPYTQQNGNMSEVVKRENSDTKRIKTDIALMADNTILGNITIRGYLHSSQQGLPTNILYNPVTSERTWNNDCFIQGQIKKNLTERSTLLVIGKYSYNHSRYLNTDVNNSLGVTDNKYIQQQGYLSAVARYNLTDRLSASVAEDISYSTLNGNNFSILKPKRTQLNGAYRIKYAGERVVAVTGVNHIYTTDIDINRVSPFVATNIHLFPKHGINIRASVKEAVRIPTFNDLYFEQVGRRDLRPEKARLYSAGMVWSKNYRDTEFMLYSDFFYNDITDKITAVPGKSIALWMMRNIGHTISRGFENGLELSTSYHNFDINLSAAYTYQRAMDKTNPSGTTYNHQLAYTPRHSGSVILTIQNKNTGGSINNFASGAYYSNSYNGKEYRMPSYSETGVSVWHNFSVKNSTIQLRAEVINLFDTRYELVTNYPMPGRQFRIGANITL